MGFSLGSALKGAVTGFTTTGNPWGAVAGAVGQSIFDSVQSNSANAKAKRQMKMQNAMNVNNMQHQYQWTVQDMKNAGLNPNLAYEQGSNAVAPVSGPDANQTAKTQINQQIMEAMNSASTRDLNAKQGITAVSQAELNDAEKQKTLVEKGLLPKKIFQEIKESNGRINRMQTEIQEAVTRMNYNLVKQSMTAEQVKQIKGGLWKKTLGTDPSKLDLFMNSGLLLGGGLVAKGLASSGGGLMEAIDKATKGKNFERNLQFKDW